MIDSCSDHSIGNRRCALSGVRSRFRRTSSLHGSTAPDEQADFIERLAKAGVRGLVVAGDPLYPPLSELMVEAANRHALPVLVGAYPGCSYDQLFRTVAAANGGIEKRSLGQIMRVHNEVRIGLMTQRSSAELIDALTRVLGCRPLSRRSGFVGVSAAWLCRPGSGVAVRAGRGIERTRRHNAAHYAPLC